LLQHRFGGGLGQYDGDDGKLYLPAAMSPRTPSHSVASNAFPGSTVAILVPAKVSAMRDCARVAEVKFLTWTDDNLLKVCGKSVSGAPATQLRFLFCS
jgi:hypothetical protein